jgi:acetolactate synthase I/II/III large subunit
LKADNPEDFRKCLEEAFKANKPMIVEAIISSREYDTLVLKKDKAA